MWKHLAAAAGLVGGLAAVPVAAWATPAPPALSSANPNAQFIRSCAVTSGATAFCDALLNPDRHTPGGGGTPSGYGPAQLRSAYNLPSGTAGTGQTVAIVDAYDDPSAETDMSTYRSQFGIGACTSASGCFKKVNQSGGTTYPKANGGWAQEISLDLDMASAICPLCHIDLVEATSASMTDLGTAVNEAAALGATVISNSYGGSESRSDTQYDSAYFDHPGVVITASTGDSGYGAQYPASSQYVVAAGGTTLSDSGGVFSETAWSGAGSGCSAYDPQPSWQSAVGNITSVCSMRGEADVAADADPNTGVAVYDSYAYQGRKGWLVFGGTSVASPVIASTFALAGGAPTGSSPAAYLYAHPSALNDVTSGSNGSCGTDLCNATTGWDGPTGLGTPHGTGAF